jgi:hypothetical protein
MENTVHMLVLTELLTVRFPEQLVEGPAVAEPGGDYAKNLTQPTVVGRAASVSKAWHKEVTQHRNAVLLKVVDDMHMYILISALAYINIDMYEEVHDGELQVIVPPETAMRIKVRLGSREMYAVEAVRRTIEPAGDGVPCELVVQPCMRSFKDTPAKTCMQKDVPVHRLCWVQAADRTPSEKQEFDDWHDAAYESLRMLLEHWKNVFTCRL